jgi:diadenylate cyclase
VIPVVYAWLLDRWQTFAENFQPLRDTIDILAVAWVVYWLLMRIKGTRAAQMALGLLILVLAWRLASLLELATLSFLLDNFLSSGLLILIVIFQSDIRRALTRVGRGVFGSTRTQEAHTIEEIVRACQALAQRRVGALVAIEREVHLDEFVEQGTPLDAELTRDLLISIFLPYSPLHDGAVVVRRDRIATAGCILPLAMRATLSSALGTRHRAAVGVTEETDALVVVVSEETGKISLVAGGEIREDLDGPHLREALLELSGDARDTEPDPPETPEEEGVKESRVAEVR